jgi:hypothetical protein
MSISHYLLFLICVHCLSNTINIAKVWGNFDNCSILLSISKILENLQHFSFFALLNLCSLLLQHHQRCPSLEKLENYYVLLSISKILETFSISYSLLNLCPLLLQHHQYR